MFSCRHFEVHNTSHDHEYKFEAPTIVEEYFGKQDLVADILEGETLLFWCNERASNDTLLRDEVKDSKEAVSFEEEESTTPVAESAYYSMQEDPAHEDNLQVEHNDDSVTTTMVLSDSEEFTFKGNI